MATSRGRFLLVKVAIPALVGNVVINALLGAVIYRSGTVPLIGNPSVGADTLVGSFLIGFFTWLVVVPGARLEAQSGRVKGFGLRTRPLQWAMVRPWLGALAVGGLLILACAVPTIQILVARYSEAMPRSSFLIFKAVYAGSLGLIAAVLAALVGLAPEEEVKDLGGWCVDPNAPIEGQAYPCDYLDKAALAVTDRARGCTGTPTWDLHVRGALDPAHVRRALEHTVTRYPSLAMRVQSLDGIPPFARRFRYAFDPEFRIDRIFGVVDARGDEAVLEHTTRELRSRYLDPYADFPVTLTLIHTTDDTCRLVFRQHHEIADGRAFIGLLVDFATYLSTVRAAASPTPEALAPIGRRGELEALGLTPPRQLVLTIGGLLWWIGVKVRALLRPLAPLAQNRGVDYTGENGTVHWAVTDDVLDVWSAARKRLDISLNTLLTGALFLANQRWHRSRGLPLGRTSAELLMETRPRAGSFVSFANHLTFLEVEADLAEDVEPSALLRSLQAQAVAQRDRSVPIKRLLWERTGVLLLPLAEVKKMIFERTSPRSSLNFSNLIPLEFTRLRGEGWDVEDVRITTPVAPMHGIVLTVIRYGGRITFNFNYKSTAVTREQTEQLCIAFQHALRELAASSAARQADVTGSGA